MEEEKSPLLLDRPARDYFTQIRGSSQVVVEGVLQNPPSQVLFLVLNVIVGSGLLSQAYVFREAGLIAAIFLYIVSVITLNIASDLLIKCCCEIMIYDYGAIIEEALGQDLKFIFQLSMLCASFGNVIFFMALLASFLNEVFDQIFPEYSIESNQQLLFVPKST